MNISKLQRNQNAVRLFFSRTDFQSGNLTDLGAVSPGLYSFSETGM